MQTHAFLFMYLYFLSLILSIQMSTSEKPQPPDPPDISNGSGGVGLSSSSSSSQPDVTANATIGDTKVPAKKKKVSFKFGLETSDDVHIVKKEPIASFAPPVPIIKKECLTRAIRIARGGESIIMPSRLTGLTQKFRNNTANNIDKLNSLTFKSQVTSANASSSSSDTDDESNVITDEKNITDRVHTDDDDAEDDDGDAGSTRRGYRLTKESSKHLNKVDVDDESIVATQEQRPEKEEEDDRLIDETVGGKNSGEKRFVLPKRSVHSSRVIKPNKRFMDETQASTKKNGITSRKKANKTETNEKRSDSPLQPSSSKSSTEDLDTDTKNGNLF